MSNEKMHGLLSDKVKFKTHCPIYTLETQSIGCALLDKFFCHATWWDYHKLNASCGTAWSLHFDLFLMPV